MKIEIVEKWLNQIAEDYKQNIDAKGITSSGNTKRKTKVIIRDDGGAIEVPLYNRALVAGGGGRRPNTNQNPEALKGFVNWAGSTFLKQWAKDKGLPTGISYAVAWKIAKEGWKIPNNNKSGRNFNDGTLLSDTITEAKKQALMKDLGKFYISDIKTMIEIEWQA